jgi:hypothetical protein
MVVTVAVVGTLLPQADSKAAEAAMSRTGGRGMESSSGVDNWSIVRTGYDMVDGPAFFGASS